MSNGTSSSLGLSLLVRKNPQLHPGWIQGSFLQLAFYYVFTPCNRPPRRPFSSCCCVWQKKSPSGCLLSDEGMYLRNPNLSSSKSPRLAGERASVGLLSAFCREGIRSTQILACRNDNHVHGWKFHKQKWQRTPRLTRTPCKQLLLMNEETNTRNESSRKTSSSCYGLDADPSEGCWWLLIWVHRKTITRRRSNMPVIKNICTSYKAQTGSHLPPRVFGDPVVHAVVAVQ